jgi:5'-nucleotidase (lipoprotein e(P4) family)
VAAHANLDAGIPANKTMKKLRLALPLVLLTACAAEPQSNDPTKDLGLLWVKHSAEYQTLSRQAYLSATRDLPEMIADSSWSALPEQTDAAELPPAIILDVDETVVSNVDFQLEFERPFDNWKLNEWTSRTNAVEVAGVRDFIEFAQSQGVTVFFVTNRPCELIDGDDDPCPQKESTIDDIGEIGISTDAAHVMLSEERGWTREKSTRRLHVAETHRVIMLFGDDLSDFIPCVRSSPKAPCTNAATQESRAQAVVDHAEYWGKGWYMLPNPMHGSWTGAH